MYQIPHPHSPCLNPQVDSLHICRYKWFQENRSAVTYIGHGYVCIQTYCEYVLLNSLTIHSMVPQINRCFCNLSSVSGCDFDFSVPIWTQEQLVVTEVYRNIRPAFIGMGLELIQWLLQHPDLTQTLDSIREQGNASALLVMYNASEIVCDSGNPESC